jgi:hypothetical protein
VAGRASRALVVSAATPIANSRAGPIPDAGD